MSAFTITIDDTPDHDIGVTIARTLRRVGDELREMPDGVTGSGTIRDLKGQAIGSWTFMWAPDVFVEPEGWDGSQPLT